MASNSLRGGLKTSEKTIRPPATASSVPPDEDQQVAARRGLAVTQRATSDVCIAGRAGTELPFRLGAHGSKR